MTDVPPVFAYQINLRWLEKGPVTVEATVEETARGSIARHLDLVELSHFQIQGQCNSAPENGFVFNGNIEAEVVQTCITTMEPVREKVSESIQVLFLSDEFTGAGRPRKHDRNMAANDIQFDPEEDDIEYYHGESVDIGDVMVQYLALAINPFPRSSTSTQEIFTAEGAGTGTADTPEEKNSPFAILKEMKDKT